MKHSLYSNMLHDQFEMPEEWSRDSETKLCENILDSGGAKMHGRKKMTF
jgi:hypothetical protein